MEAGTGTLEGEEGCELTFRSGGVGENVRGWHNEFRPRARARPLE